MDRMAQSLVVWTVDSESEAARHEVTIHHVVIHSDAIDSESVTAAKMKSDSCIDLVSTMIADSDSPIIERTTYQRGKIPSL